ncbi:hypothetical protein HHK36_020509 [Tetracentron sinense]|uniref:DUF668 domain-containing protein n=1 Tax=Tetracentron sinense TaxID=13715 RepID=A0A834YU27_TETSI|nr:hypothetical protein HHK36_020509 [Tetracentron sinense]
MVAEPWIFKMGNQVSNNLKHALFLDPSKKKTTKKHEQKEIIGILSFEVANVMSKTVNLHKSLTDQEIFRLKNEILKSEGVRNLVSSDESHLLQLVLTEKLDDLNRVAAVVSRLGKKCTETALQGFEHVYADIMTGVIHVRELGFLVKDLEGITKKMERYVSLTSNLYNKMGVLNELEQSTKKFQQNQPPEESHPAFEQKLIWQRQDVRHLRDISLWNQAYDKIVGLLARAVCTIYARICIVFRDSVSMLEFPPGGEGSPSIQESRQLSSRIDSHRHAQMASEALPALNKSNGSHDSHPGSIEKAAIDRRGITVRPGLKNQRSEVALFHQEDFSFPCGTSPGRLFMECLSLSSSASKIGNDIDYEDRNSQSSSYYSFTNGLEREHPYPSGRSNQVEMGVSFSCLTSRSQFVPKSKLMVHAPPSTVGGSALALHYANVIIIIEKLLRYPHLVGEEARDNLYQMLPTSLRTSLSTNLKKYVKNLAIYDASLAHDWKEKLEKLMEWLGPLAYNMIKWQTERNFEQQQIITRTNVLLLQTLYFADREKTEAAICELLVGLNYMCRYEHQQNALLGCASSFDDCMEWQLQY